MAIVSAPTRPTWKKITFYYNHVMDAEDTTLATANADGVTNIYDRNESTIWQVDASQSTAEIFTYDLSNQITCDYFAIGWHNFGTLGGVSLDFSHSTDGATWTDVVSGLSFSNDNTVIKEFDTQTKEYWRMQITFTDSDRPQAAYIIWGEKTELDYSSVGFEPNQRLIKDIRHINQNGYLNKINTRYTERKCKVQIDEAQSDVYDSALDWHETIRNNNFFMGWENETHETDAFIMRSTDGKLLAPITKNEYRNININLVGHTI